MKEEIIRNPFYDPKIPKTKPIDRLTKFILFFLPTYTVVESPIAIHYKVFRNTVYIVGEEKL